MTSTLGHYAVAAALLALLGCARRTVALGGLFAAAPDLDVLTAIPWTLAAPALPLDADTLLLGAHLFGHRGLSHTLLAAGLAALVTGLAVRSLRWAGVAGLAWASHVALDAFTPWPLAPLWPFSSLEVRYPIVTTLDPLLTLVSVAALVALLGPLVVDRYPIGSMARRERLTAFGHAWGRRLALASLAVLALHVAWLGGVAAAQDVPLSATHSANLPRTATVLDTDGGFEVQHRWSPFDDGETRHVAERQNRTARGNATQAMDAVACALPGLGPYGDVADPTLIARPATEGLIVEARDVVRNATTGGPHLQFHVVDGEILEAQTTREGQRDWFRIGIPAPVLEAAACR